jgi:hypothetical protein
MKPLRNPAAWKDGFPQRTSHPSGRQLFLEATKCPELRRPEAARKARAAPWEGRHHFQPSRRHMKFFYFSSKILLTGIPTCDSFPSSQDKAARLNVPLGFWVFPGDNRSGRFFFARFSLPLPQFQ